MRALRLLEWGSDPVLVEREEPRPGPGQVVVRIGGAGACHSDLHLMREFQACQVGAQGVDPARVLVPERERRLPADLTGLEIGQPVAVYGPWGCGTCPRCQLGIESDGRNPSERWP